MKLMKLYSLIQKPKQSIVYLTTSSQMKRRFQIQFRTMLDNHLIAYKLDQNNCLFSFANGTKIRGKSINEIKDLRGLDISKCIIDEQIDTTDEKYEQLFHNVIEPALHSSKGKKDE